MKPWYTSTLGRVLLVMFVVALWALSSRSRADVIEFPEEELSRESVLPVFDQPEAVKKRFVPTEGRFEVSGFGGVSLNDPFLNNIPVGVGVLYHLSEVHSFGVQAAFVSSTLSSYTGQIQNSVTGGTTIPFDLNPAPQYWGLGEYEFTPFYGKISLTKQAVLNLNISGTVRAGMIGLNDNTSSFAGGLGLNQRFFFTRNFGMKIDLSALIYQKGDIIPFEAGQRKVVANKTETTLFITLGAVWLFPSL